MLIDPGMPRVSKCGRTAAADVSDCSKSKQPNNVTPSTRQLTLNATLRSAPDAKETQEKQERRIVRTQEFRSLWCTCRRADLKQGNVNIESNERLEENQMNSANVTRITLRYSAV